VIVLEKIPSMTHDRAGLYIHVPFCRRKCPYCDFYSITDRSLQPAFVAAVLREMQMHADEAAGRRFDTIYLGGGTPSLLSPRQVGRLLNKAFQTFALAAEPEITMEANPGTLSMQRLREYRCAGVNRLTIGLQSLDDQGLAFLGRMHSVHQGLCAVKQARQAGFTNLGLDLIYGRPGQSAVKWQNELRGALTLEPQHLSCYLLTLENGTPLDRDRRHGRFEPLDEQTQALLFETTHDVLTNAGFDHYEIANFARSPWWRSRHNSKYWRRAPYIGLGPAAHSFIEPQRRWNHPAIGPYLAAVGQGRRPTAGQETLTRAQQMTETIMLGLRTADGIRLDEFADRFGTRLEQMAAAPIGELKADGLIRLSRGFLRPRPKGFLLADAMGRMVCETICERCERQA
jgi:oxygen-independent coproporphyrinogen-3 oxidase